jgi:hypothetical protein
MGRQHLNVGNYSEAGPYLTRALAIREKSHGPDNITMTWVLNDYVENLWSNGLITEAIKNAYRSEDIARNHLRQYFTSASGRQALSYDTTKARSLDMILSTCVQTQEKIKGVGGEDGILTAEEVAALDLSGVDWVILSACDTGVGIIRAGEGVLGLRRAFQIAGAQTLITSLWAVDDESTRKWMRYLYEKRFLKEQNTAESVHQASLEVLQERRRENKSTHPFYWAGFIASGDWR